MRWSRTAGLGLAALAFAACTPAGLEFGGGASSSFSSVGTAISPADTEAQALLLNVAAGAMAISLDEGGAGYAGLTAARLNDLDPSIRSTGDVAAKVGVVSLNHAGTDGAVLSTKSTTGRVFCVALLNEGGQPETGSVDARGATSVADCTGKHWSLGF